MKKIYKYVIAVILVVVAFIISLQIYSYILHKYSRLDYSFRESMGAQFSMLARAMIVYKSDFGTWPPSDSWKLDLEPFIYKEFSYNDVWGNPIQYVNTVEDGNSVVKIYSFGENGVDENGLNDDYSMDILECGTKRGELLIGVQVKKKDR